MKKNGCFLITVCVALAALVLTACPNTVGSGATPTPVPTPDHSDYVSPAIGTLKYVPAGTFQRDGTAGNTSTVSAFRMSQNEITRAQFAAILGTDPSETLSSSGMSDPVQQTNWYHAIAFCNELSLAEGLTPVYSVSGVDFATLTYAAIPIISDPTWDAAVATWSNNGYRLPTEMEWMWAAMGATAGTTGYGKAFAGSTGSNSIGAYAVYGYFDSPKNDGQTITERTNSVGSKLPNELGLYDMSGNVWEWSWDLYGTYPTGAVTDYRGAASGAGRVRRGGGWRDDASYCAVAYRSVSYPNYPNNFIGFRVVRP
jgi:formylglycine-generating enzyme required for sulfatase activity/predicted small secreted protein